MPDFESVQESIDKAVLNKKISKWLPRLKDDSNEVREEAAEILSSIAASQPELRSSLVPLLLNHCFTEKSWPVVCNGILFNISFLPEKETAWLESFLDAYIELASIPDNFSLGSGSIRGAALYYIWDLIESRTLLISHSKMKKISLLVEAGLSRKGDRAAIAEEKLYLTKIHDWIEDS